MRLSRVRKLVLDDPVFMKRLAAAVTLGSAALWVAAAVTGWVSSVVFVSHVSMAALVFAGWSWWQAARVESRQYDDADVADVLREVRALRDALADRRGQ